MEKEDSVRTVDCLRGRLLVERAATRNAKEEAQQLGKKLTELENLLKQEAKLQKRAEKKLRFLLKKLESVNISYASYESQHSELLDKSDISSISSSTSSTIKEHNTNVMFQKDPKNLQQNDSQKGSFSLSEGTSISAFEGRNRNSTSEDSLSSTGDEHLEKSSLKMDLKSVICSGSIKSSANESLNKEDDQDSNSQIDNSMALVLIDSPKKNGTIDPEVLDATVKEVLDVLRRAKEQLQSSMERRRMNVIRVG